MNPTNGRKTWKIGSGAKLSGTATIHGNKNAALPCLAASVLLPIGGVMILDHMPRISDVAVLLDILMHLGIQGRWVDEQRIELTRITESSTAPHIPPALTAHIRGSIVLLGALAGLYQSFVLPKPGGDKIGGRPIGAHVTALADLGVQIIYTPEGLSATRTNPVHGGTVILTEQSVTGTLMLLLYSAFLTPDDRLTIIDAACEPHIVTLCSLLRSMGAHIDGIYSNLLTISWPHGRHTPTHPTRIDDDFMEAATYAVAAAVTHSDLAIPFNHAGLYLRLMDRYLNWMGVTTRLEEQCWHIIGSTSDLMIDPSLKVIKAEPWPRFPTDVMSLFVVLATQCQGTLTFVEYMYDDRFGFVQNLRDIGARIIQQPPHTITVTGPTPLAGNETFLRPDIRSGAAMLLAALASSGTTVLHDRGGVIERGYENLPQTLATLGAPIEKMENIFSFIDAS